MERRKIEKIDDIYMAVKPSKDIEGAWERLGKKYDCRGLASLLETNIDIEFILSEEIEQDLETYRVRLQEKRRFYLMK